MNHREMRPAPVHTLVLIGPHGSGKTTLGLCLGNQLGWRRDVEIGEVLRREALSRNDNAHALASQPDFDLEVTRAELRRDAASIGPRIIETWHPGNLAYAQLRNPDLAKHLEPVLRNAVQARSRRLGRVLVQPLGIDRVSAVARRSEPGPDDLVDFFLRVGEGAMEIAERWGLEVAPLIHTDQCTVESAAALIAARVGPAAPGRAEAYA